MGCGQLCWEYTKKGAAVIRKECFTDMCYNSSFFYFVILLWIFLVVLNIFLYGLLLVGIWQLEDKEAENVYMNIFMQIICGLFTFTALANLPVRIKRYKDLYKIGGRDSFMRKPAGRYRDESALIFDHLKWRTRYIIIQGLLWNCIFQLLNQGTRCVYYSAVSAAEFPGVIWVNVFFALSILSALVAALTQAIAENRFRQQFSLKNETTCWKTLKEMWYKLWKVQAEAYMRFASTALKVEEARSDSLLSPGIIKSVLDNLDEKEIPHDQNFSKPALPIQGEFEVKNIVRRSSNPGVEMTSMSTTADFL